MTNRDFYTAIVNANINDELTAFAQDALEKLDHTNELRRAANVKKAAAKEEERQPRRQAIFDVLTTEPKTATTLIAEAGLEVTPQSIPSLLKPLVEQGLIEKVDVKVKGKGVQKGYKLA